MSDNARGCQRLVAIVKAHGSAELLQTCELLRLADWLSQPPGDAHAWLWAEQVCVPIVQELGRRLQRQLDAQTVNVPTLLGQVHAMRSAQRAVASAKNKSREAKLALHHQLAIAERTIDDLIDEHYQPTLFRETQ